MNHADMKIILASQSPRRIELLKQITTDFEVIPSPITETIDPKLTPSENAIALALKKAQWTVNQHKSCLVIGADTIVVLDGEIIGKPTDKTNAFDILKRLGGREHEVITGVAVINGGIFMEASVSTVAFKDLRDEEIIRYIDTGEPMDKAGAYAIQGEGAFMVSGYKGSYTNIIGFPMELVRDLLGKAGYAVK